jgi:uncharacterized protein (DUF849 family)
MIKACLNGRRTRDEHPAVPLTAVELARDARACLAAGASAVHVHPRDADGGETLDPDVCAAVVRAVRPVCPVGFTSGGWIPGRLSAIEAWFEAPDFASVNFSEQDAGEVCDALARKGVAVEAGLASVADAERFIRSRVHAVRALVETDDLDTVAEIEALLPRLLPQLHHGYDGTWPVIRRALGRGRDVRIGLEDTLRHEDGRVPRANAELVAAVAALTAS